MYRSLAVCLCAIFLVATAPADASDNSSREWPEVELYTTDWCPYCIKAKVFFDHRRIPYTLYDIEKSKEAAFKKQRIAPGAGIPVVVIDGIIIKGYSEKAFKTALELEE